MPSPYYYYVYPFGQNADDLTSIPTNAAMDGSVSYYAGWTDPYEYNLLTNPAALPIPRGQMNQLFYDITNNLQEYQQYGTPQWVTGNTVPYPIYARVYYGGVVYENQLAANTATPGTDSTWAVISANSGGIRTGTILEFGGNSVPSGYLLCDGSAVSRTTYAGLYAAIGTIWGSGDGTTTFNLPNFQRRTAVGSGGTGTAILGNTVGSVGGTETYTLATNDLPAHNHPAPGGAAFQLNGSGSTGSVSGTANQQSLTTGNNSTTNNPISLIQPSNVVLKIIKT